MSRHTLQCCPICNEPIEVVGNYGHLERKYAGKSGLKIEIGSSVGGWGHFREWLTFREEVCDACYGTLGEMLTPAIEFVRSGGKREGDHVQPMRSDKPSSAGRGAALLRLLSPFHNP